MILFFLGWFTVKFWIILAIVGINYITKSMRPKTHRRTQYTYRTYTQQDFEDFFEEPLGVSMEDNIKGVLREIMGTLCDIYRRFNKILYGIGSCQGSQ